MEAGGAFSIVLESIPRELAAEITRELRIPTIGIGAGPDCDGQILVLHDLIGLSVGHTPKFVRRYANVAETISRAVSAYTVATCLALPVSVNNCAVANMLTAIVEHRTALGK